MIREHEAVRLTSTGRWQLAELFGAARRAVDAIRMNRPVRAITLLRAAVESQPRSAPARSVHGDLARAVDFLQREQFNEALSILLQTMRRRKRRPH